MCMYNIRVIMVTNNFDFDFDLTLNGVCDPS